MKKTFNRLTLIYYGFYVLAVALATAGFACLAGQPPLIDERSTAGVALTSVYILLLVVSIPLSLKLFSVRVKRLDEADNEEEREARFRNYATRRLVVVGADMIIGIALFYLLNSQSMIFCAAIAAVALVFCKPR